MFNEQMWVSPKVSVLLKELGFDEECFGKYEKLDNGDYIFWETFRPVTYDDVTDDEFTTPKVWLIEWWLMQNHGIELDYELGMEGLEKTLESLVDEKRARVK